MPDLTVSVIIVSWNVCDLLRGCLASLPAGVEVIVVDNASRDGSAAMVAAEFPQARLIANAENRGFTAGNNQGLAAAHGRYIFFLNPDTVLHPGALDTLVAYLQAHPDVVRYLYEEERASLEDLERTMGRRIVLKARPDFHQEDFEVVG